MYIKSIITASLLALSSTGYAVQVAFDNIQFGALVNGVATTTFGVDDLNFSSQTQGLDGNPRVTLDFQFSNTRNSAVLDGFIAISDIGSTGPRVPANLNASTFGGASFNFTLDERVTYSVSGSIFNLVSNNPQDTSAMYYGLHRLALPFPSTAEQLNQAFATSTDYGIVGLPLTSGTLEPGYYQWQTGTGSSLGGQANSNIRFAFDRVTTQGPKVPDAGSTLLMLGLALSSLALVKRS